MSSSDEDPSNYENTPMRRKDNGFGTPVEGEHDTYQASSRNLQLSCLNKFDWSWRLAISVLLTITMMLIYLIGETLHFNDVRAIADIYNSTGRIEQVLVTAENFQR